jgi:hypothetical protein
MTQNLYYSQTEPVLLQAHCLQLHIPLAELVGHPFSQKILHKTPLFAELASPDCWLLQDV